MSAAHLESAARALSAILAHRHPEHVWTAWVEEDGEDACAGLASATSELDGGAVADNERTIGNRQLAATTGGSHDDRGQEAA